MNFMRAVGFLVVGLVLGKIPEWIPSWCATAGADGESTREIWLGLMSWVQVAIGSGYILRSVGALLAKALRYQPRAEIEAPQRAPARPWATTLPTPRRVAMPRVARKRKLLPLPVAFKTRAAEEQRAA